MEAVAGESCTFTDGTYFCSWRDFLRRLPCFISCLLSLRGLFLGLLLAVIPVIDRIIPTIPIQVRVARSGVYRVALQPAGGAGVIRAGAHMVEADFRYPLVPIRPVPSERLLRRACTIDQSIDAKRFESSIDIEM